MSNKRLGGPPHSRRDDIEDAEFIEVENWKPSSPPPPSTWSKFASGCQTAILIVSAVFFLLILVAIYSVRQMHDDAPANVEGAVADQERSDLPSVTELLQQNDPRACGHPETVAVIRSEVLPSRDADHPDFSDEEFARVLELARTDLTEVTASDIRSDLHEIKCEANLRYGDGEHEVTAISFKIRPSVDPGGPAVYYFSIAGGNSWWLTKAILSGPETIVKSEWPLPTPPPPKDPVAAPSPENTPTGDEATAAPSDEAAFAPH
jgi:hypothetical protein